MTSCSALGQSGSTNQCNAISDDGPKITAVAMADTPPAPTGGTIVDGTYELTELVLHTGPGGSTKVPSESGSAVLQIRGASMQQVGTVKGVELRYTRTLTTSGTTLTTNDTCPTVKTEGHSFSATNTELRIYDSAAGVGTVEQIYSHR